MNKARYLHNYILKDLSKKMVFLGGPRQVGKTTLALSLVNATTEEHPAYLNWDTREGKKSILGGEFPSTEKIIILDEVHKYSKWRNLVKGFFDSKKSKHSFLITGSARLDLYLRGGDSLQGRYFYYRLHPLSLYELNQNCERADLEKLLKFGGFPEPFFSENEIEWKRWQNSRKARVLQEDVVGLEEVKQLGQLDLLMDILPSRVGSPLSIRNLREDFDLAHETVERYVQILEKLYYCYRISPYGPPQIKAVKKEKKCYLWDWSLCEDRGARIENFVASTLLKYCHFHEDILGDKMELRFIKDKNKLEIDFVVLKDKKPLFAVECKSGSEKISPSIVSYAKRTKIPQFYQTHLGSKDYEVDECRTRILPLTTFCREVLKV